MKHTLTFDAMQLRRVSRLITNSFPWTYFVLGLAITLSISVVAISSVNDLILTYSDAESHINIAKRVLSSNTPGFAQLGGIWLPLPHLLMLPFIWNDYMWRSGLGGAVVSSISYVLGSIVLYKLMILIFKSRGAALCGTLIFMLNVNILFMQSTAMSELPLILFFLLTTYFFVKYAITDSVTHLLLAGAFGFCATLSRYDGWFLVFAQSLLIIAKHIHSRSLWGKMQGKLVMFATIAFFGIGLWLMWGYAILGDPLYFTNSQFSAKSQQDIIRANGSLFTYHSLPLAILYYSVAAMTNAGMLMFAIAIAGFSLFARTKHILAKREVTVLLLVPFAFYVITLFAGQTVLYLPHLNNGSLFNVRYGLMAVPFVAFFVGYRFLRSKFVGRAIIIGLLFVQLGLYVVGYAPVITFDDGTAGSSFYRNTNAEVWLRDNYTDGYVLMDDYARSLSLVHTNIPMDKFIYLGNNVNYDKAIKTPEKMVSWIILRRGDLIWKELYNSKAKQSRTLRYYELVHNSNNVNIFRRKVSAQK